MKIEYTSNGSLQEIEFDENNSKDIIEKTAPLRQSLLSKYLASDNLNFLISNGCSICADSRAINETGEEANYKTILNDFTFLKGDYAEIQEKINSFSSERPEIALDRLFEIKAIIEKIYEDDDSLSEIVELIEKVKEAFLKEYILTIDYSKNDIHKLFLKKIISRDSKLDKPNFFTLNYDLLLEKSAEQLGLYVNNGFWGFYDRFFMPSTYQIDIHLQNSEGGKRIRNGVRLFKLHGSLSWNSDNSKPPYGIAEKQIQLDTDHKIKYEDIATDLIIYPIQSKKKHSLDLPYSEIFRQLVEKINNRNSVLMIIGYSFLDEHVNDIITNSLANPDFNLLVFSYENPEEAKSEFLKELYKSSQNDKRISVLHGGRFGDFEFITKFLMPYSDDKDPKEIFYKTFLELQKLTIK
ncbi:MAG: SIR2 family protein [Acholeplasma sp.]|nr:SIR2 family protein [Acholeplasma sp.]